MRSPFASAIMEMHTIGQGIFFQGKITCPFRIGEFLQLAAHTYRDKKIWITLSSQHNDITILIQKPSDSIPSGMRAGDLTSSISTVYLSSQTEDNTIEAACSAIADFANDTELIIRLSNNNPVIGQNYILPIDTHLDRFLLTLSTFSTQHQSNNSHEDGFLCGGLIYRLSQLENALDIAVNYFDSKHTALRIGFYSLEHGLELLIEKNNEKKPVITGISFPSEQSPTLPVYTQSKKTLLQMLLHTPVALEIHNQYTPETFTACTPHPLKHFLLNLSKMFDDTRRETVNEE